MEFLLSVLQTHINIIYQNPKFVIMKKLNLSFITLFAFAALLFTACDEDIIDPGTGDGNDTPPSISLVTGRNVTSIGDINIGHIGLRRYHKKKNLDH